MIRGPLSTTDAATPRLREIASYLARPEALYKDCGRRLANDLRAYFVTLDEAQSGKHGAMSTHFWSDVRASVGNPIADGSGASVSINHLAFAQKLYGGTITAKNGRALTIPIDPRAYGRRVSVFEQEVGVKVFRPKGKRLLMANIDGKAIPIYALAASVTQHADPHALPAEGVLQAGVLDTAEKHLARKIAQG